METFDIFLLAVIGAGAVWGFIKGFIHTLFSWAGPIVSALITNQWAIAVADQFFPKILENKYHILFFGIGFFLVTAFIIGLTAIFIKKIINFSNLGLFDHLCGMFLGAFFGSLVIGFIAAFLIQFSVINKPTPFTSLVSQGSLKTFELIKAVFR